jgi:predicted transcriptional regulator
MWIVLQQINFIVAFSLFDYKKWDFRNKFHLVANLLTFATKYNCYCNKLQIGCNIDNYIFIKKSIPSLQNVDLCCKKKEIIA